MNFDKEVKKDCQNAIWMEYEDAEFLVNSFSNRDFQRNWEQIRRPYRKKIEAREISVEKELQLMAKAVGESVILDWKNVFDKDETPKIHSAESAAQLFLSSSPFRDALIEFCSQEENFITKAEASLGNDSRPTRSGGPIGAIVSNS